MKGILAMGKIKSKYGFWECLILRITQGVWNKYISCVLCKASSTGVLDSKQLHTLAAQFDPSVKKINGETFGIETDLRKSKDFWME